MSDPERDEFHKWIGYSISAWAKVEERLFEVFWKALGAPKERAAIVYYRAPTLDARLTLTDELVKSALPKPERKSGGHPHPDVVRWNEIHTSIKSLLSIRRRIAHYPVRTVDATFKIDPEGDDGFQFSWYELYVSESEALRGKSTEPHGLLLTDLVDHDETLMKLADQLHAFERDVLVRHVQ